MVEFNRALYNLASVIEKSHSQENLQEIAYYYAQGMSAEEMGISERKLERYLNQIAFVYPLTFIMADSQKSQKLGTQ